MNFISHNQQQKRILHTKSFREKLYIIDFVEKHPTMSQKSAAAILGMKQQTLCQLLRNKERFKIKASLRPNTNQEQFRSRRITFEDVDKALLVWIRENRAQEAGHLPSKESIHLKACQFATEFGHCNSEGQDRQISMSWISRFMKRHGFSGSRNSVKCIPPSEKTVMTASSLRQLETLLLSNKPVISRTMFPFSNFDGSFQNIEPMPSESSSIKQEPCFYPEKINMDTLEDMTPVSALDTSNTAAITAETRNDVSPLILHSPDDEVESIYPEQTTKQIKHNTSQTQSQTEQVKLNHSQHVVRFRATCFETLTELSSCLAQVTSLDLLSSISETVEELTKLCRENIKSAPQYGKIVLQKPILNEEAIFPFSFPNSIPPK